MYIVYFTIQFMYEILMDSYIVHVHCVYLFILGYSSLLRKRYDSLLTSSTQHQQRLEEARRRRAEFDDLMETMLPRLQELEERSAAVEESRDKISDRLETLRVSDCIYHVICWLKMSCSGCISCSESVIPL